MKKKTSKVIDTGNNKTAQQEDAAAENLYKSPSFQWRVALKLILMLGVLFLIQGFFTNWWLTKKFNDYVEAADIDVSNRLFVAKQELTNRIVKEFETERIKQTVTDVASNRANSVLISQLQPEVTRFKAEVTNQLESVALTLDQLTNASVFAIAVLRAQAGERSAFEVLRGYAGNRNFSFHAEADQAVDSIKQMHNENAGQFWGSYLPPWGDKPDPKLPLEEVIKMYNSEQHFGLRIGLMDKTWERTDLSKRQKMGFLIRLMRTEQNLKALSRAGEHFRGAANYNLITLATAEYLDWWKANEANVSDEVPK